MRGGNLLHGLHKLGPYGAGALRAPFMVRKLAEQLRRPRGLLGQLTGLLLSRLNQRANEWTLGLLDIHPTDKVLEVGFGPGLAIQKAATIAVQGWVAGVDFSETMVQLARKRNAPAIAVGRVDLQCGSLTALPYAADTFDKAFAVNVMYYLPEPLASLKELWRVMKPGGRIALFLVAKEDLAKRFIARTGVLTLYSGEEVAQLLAQAGFRRAWFETTRLTKVGMGVCAVAVK
jgi:ubiquinone/menaquinone biosynthesis C-methylase UbiE